MKIVNETKYKTGQLRKLAMAVAMRELDTEDRKRVVVTFRNGRKYVTGRGLIGRMKSWVWIPSRPENFHHENCPDAQMVEFVAMVLAHEFAHNRGMRGEHHMRHDPLTRYGNPAIKRGIYLWAREFPLELTTAKKQARPTGADHATSELAKVEEAIKRWEAKAKRAKTALTKYQRKRRYYIRRLAAMTTNHP